MGDPCRAERPVLGLGHTRVDEPVVLGVADARRVLRFVVVQHGAVEHDTPTTGSSPQLSIPVADTLQLNSNGSATAAGDQG
jgi:hypothetical protein